MSNMIKKFSTYNESVRDLMIPKSKEEVSKALIDRMNRDNHKVHFDPNEWGLTIIDYDVTGGLNDCVIIFKSEDGRKWQITIDGKIYFPIIVREKKKGVAGQGCRDYKCVEEYLTKKGLVKRVNESVRDQMITKSKEDIMKDINKLSPNDKLKMGCDREMSWIVKLGLEDGGEFSDEMGQELLQDACINGRLDIVKLLLDKDVNANTPEALSSACVSGNDSIVSLLLDNGADPNYYYGQPLKKAAESGNLGCVKLLLVHGAEMQWATSYIQKLKPNIAEYLLNYKRRNFLGKFKDYIKHKFTNESVRDLMK